MANKKIKQVQLSGGTTYDVAVKSIEHVDGLKTKLDKTVSKLETKNNAVVCTKSDGTSSNILKAGTGIAIAEDGTVSVTFADYAGAFEGNGEIVSGYNISFATGNKFIPYVCYYSLDDGTSWNDFYDIRNNANPVLTNVTQIKFKATFYLSGFTNSSGTIAIPSLSFSLSAGINSTYISDNIKLTNDILDLTISYGQSTVSGGGNDD
jgi:hypothetical protein